MIRITVELVPASGERPQLLGTAIIANDGTGDDTIGNYDARFTGRENRVYLRGKVVGFPRKALSPWHLLYRALHAVLGGRS